MADRLPHESGGGTLRESDLSVAEIGSRVGYDNAGKFTVAFKKNMKITPSEYRRERGIYYEN